MFHKMDMENKGKGNLVLLFIQETQQIGMVALRLIQYIYIVMGKTYY